MELASTPKGWLKKGIAHFGNKNAISGLSIETSVAIPLLVDTYYNDSQNIIKYSNTQILLKANKKYRLIADGIFRSPSGNDYIIAFFDVTNNIKLGSEFYAGANNMPDTWTRQAQAFAIVNPTTDIYVELRNFSSTISNINYASKVIIEELETYTLPIPKALDMMVGVGQSWQNVTGSRALDTNYSNTTEKPIQLYATAINSSLGSFGLNIQTDGHIISQSTADGTAALGFATMVSAIIPPGKNYKVVKTGGASINLLWHELR